MNLIALPALSDNCIWMRRNGNHAIAVDPVESAPVIGALDSHGQELAAILVTHHPTDSVSGGFRLRPLSIRLAPASCRNPVAVPALLHPWKMEFR